MGTYQIETPPLADRQDRKDIPYYRIELTGDDRLDLEHQWEQLRIMLGWTDG